MLSRWTGNPPVRTSSVGHTSASPVACVPHLRRLANRADAQSYREATRRRNMLCNRMADFSAALSP